MKKVARLGLWGVLALGWLLLATLQSRLLLTAIVALLLPWVMDFAASQHKWVRDVRRGIAASCLVAVAFLLPSRTADPTARVQSVLLDASGARVPMPWLPYLTNLVPESDLIRLSTLAKHVFPFPTRGPLLDELRAMGAWDNPFVRAYARFRAAGYDRRAPSVLGLQLLQQLGFYRDLTHFVVVLPVAPRGPVPLVVFLHGYMGNFQFYSEYFGELCDCAVLLPSTPNLIGRWTAADLQQIVGPERTLVEALVPVDAARVHLIGLSNGGSGVNLAMHTDTRATFRSLTFLSTWVDAPPRSWPRDKRLGVVWGESDRIAANNHQRVAALRADGYSVAAFPFPRERHFLMLTRRAEVERALREVLHAPPPR